MKNTTIKATAEETRILIDALKSQIHGFYKSENAHKLIDENVNSELMKHYELLGRISQ